MPTFSSASTLNLKSYTAAAINKNKANPEAWTKPDLFKDVADSYLQAQLRFHSIDSAAYKNALAEVDSTSCANIPSPSPSFPLLSFILPHDLSSYSHYTLRRGLYPDHLPHPPHPLRDAPSQGEEAASSLVVVVVGQPRRAGPAALRPHRGSGLRPVVDGRRGGEPGREAG
ncbi:uncharacterized protein BKCO1_1000042 [Diplodia corticola]|uniref:Uncharacterized protein n=1 Tax=Diplodia corticola TaxID=236234 RepID=A0A1J9R8U8_9PEZI|nr:uncharacterized protein BKCO1_1000042 [Diplodia corticola]OJD36594.1 hypothetical protein BKCO1_1000042 [Diplodia corticola]